jgi:hypothetical protein
LENPVSPIRAADRQAQSGVWLLHHCGGDVNDPPEFAFGHAFDHGSYEHDRRDHVGVDRSQPLVALEGTPVPHRRAASVIDQNIGRWKGCQGRCTSAFGSDITLGSSDDLHGKPLTDIRRRLL